MNKKSNQYRKAKRVCKHKQGIILWPKFSLGTDVHLEKILEQAERLALSDPNVPRRAKHCELALRLKKELSALKQCH